MTRSLPTSVTYRRRNSRGGLVVKGEEGSAVEESEVEANAEARGNGAMVAPEVPAVRVRNAVVVENASSAVNGRNVPNAVNGAKGPNGPIVGIGGIGANAVNGPIVVIEVNGGSGMTVAAAESEVPIAEQIEAVIAAVTGVDEIAADDPWAEAGTASEAAMPADPGCDLRFRKSFAEVKKSSSRSSRKASATKGRPSRPTSASPDGIWSSCRGYRASASPARSSMKTIVAN